MRAVVITEAAATIIASEWSRRHKHAPDTEIPTHVRVQMQQIAQDAVRELHNVITGHYDPLKTRRYRPKSGAGAFLRGLKLPSYLRGLTLHNAGGNIAPSR